MIAEISITPLDKGESVGQWVSEVLDIIDKSGLNYRLSPMGTCIEGDFDAVMALVAKCHKHVKAQSRRVTTQIKIDDREGKKSALDEKIRGIEKRLGRKLKS